MNLILASASPARRALLEGAGVAFAVQPPLVDEATVKLSLRARGTGARDLADALAELKALKISQRCPADLVLGCDQTLALEDGNMLDKAESLDALAGQLALLSGKTHDLWSAIVIAEAGQPVWRHIERCRMTMRPLSPQYISDYLKIEGETLRGCIGGYRVEGRGIGLFSRIEGSHSAILGLPLLPLLDYLRTRGVLAA